MSLTDRRGIFVTATDTGVGKTFVSALLVKALRDRGLDAGYLKPVASGAVSTPDGPACEDVEFVKRFARISGPTPELCPVLLEPPLSPYAAARRQGLEVDLERVAQAFARARRKHSFLVVEGVGGVLVPLTSRHTVLDLIKDLDLPALVVCRPGLGTINHTLLTLQALEGAGVEVTGFLTNGPRDQADPSVADNPALIQRFSGISFLGHVPWCRDPEGQFSSWTRFVLRVIMRLEAK